MDTNIVFSISARPTSLHLNFSLNARLTHQQSGLKSMLSSEKISSYFLAFAWFDDIVKALSLLSLLQLTLVLSIMGHYDQTMEPEGQKFSQTQIKPVPNLKNLLAFSTS